MKKIILIILILVSFVNVNAEECSSNRIAELKEYAKNVNIYYEIEKNQNIDEEVKFKIRIKDLNEDIAVFKNQSKGLKEKMLDNTYVSEGKTVPLYIYSYTLDINCTNQLLRSVNIKIPYYNYWYSDNMDKCGDDIKFKYCKELIEEDIDYNAIDELYNKYLEANKVVKDGKKNNNNLLIIIVSVGVIVLLGVTITIVKINKKRKGDLLG